LQPTLFEPLPPMVAPAYAKTDTIEQRFIAFHKANPAVYSALRSMALGIKRQGTARYGIAGLFEVLRWRYAMQTSGDPFKLNNNFRALYARLLMDNEPELADFFEVRERRAA
jgi:hypothetical protein